MNWRRWYGVLACGGYRAGERREGMTMRWIVVGVVVVVVVVVGVLLWRSVTSFWSVAAKGDVCDDVVLMA